MVADIAESSVATAQVQSMINRGLIPQWRSAPVSVRVKKADYSYRQLSSWRNTLRVLGNISDLRLRSFDLDEVRNRLVLGVAAVSDVQRQTMRAWLTEHAIPADALLIEVVPPIALDACYYPETGTIEEKQRPLEGGRQISWDDPNSCATLGYAALYDGLKYGVTNSHVTGSRWSVPQTPREFSQGTHTVSRIGVESLDPPPNAQCSVADASGLYDCRGDVALIGIDDSVQVEVGAIVRTTGRNGGSGVNLPGSTTPDPQNPRFWIRDVWRVDLPPGTEIQKIGKTSGWTWGHITKTCVDEYFPEQGWNHVLPGSVNGAVAIKCTDEADYYGTDGDSGAPVFTWSGDPQTVVMAAGINWGHAISGPLRTYFTAYKQIEEDFGGLWSGRLQVAYPIGRPDITQSYVDGGSAHLVWSATQNATSYQIDRCVDSADGRGCITDQPPVFTTSTDYYELSPPDVSQLSWTPYPNGTRYVRYGVIAFAANGVYSGESQYAYFLTSW